MLDKLLELGYAVAIQSRASKQKIWASVVGPDGVFSVEEDNAEECLKQLLREVQEDEKS